MIRIEPDWLALARNWMSEWERTGDSPYRDYILTGKKDTGAMPDDFISRGAYRYDPATKHLSDLGAPNMPTPDFMVLFGGDQIITELIQLIHCLEFPLASAMLCEKMGSCWYRVQVLAPANHGVCGGNLTQGFALGSFRGRGPSKGAVSMRLMP